MRAPHTLQGGGLLTKAINADNCPAKAAVPHRKAAASMPVCDAPPILPISNSAAMPAARTCLKPAWRQHNWGGTGSAKNTGHLILPRPCLGTWPASVGDSVFSGFSSGSECTPEGMVRPARCMRLPPYALHRDVRYGCFPRRCHKHAAQAFTKIPARQDGKMPKGKHMHATACHTWVDHGTFAYPSVLTYPPAKPSCFEIRYYFHNLLLFGGGAYICRVLRDMRHYKYRSGESGPQAYPHMEEVGELINMDRIKIHDYGT